MDWAVRLSAAIRRPVSFVMLQYPSRPEIWREVFRRADAAAERGAEIFPQVAGRPFGILAGHQTVANPFIGRPSYDALSPLPLPERARRLRDPETRRRILSEKRDRRVPCSTKARRLLDLHVVVDRTALEIDQLDADAALLPAQEDVRQIG